MSVQAGIWNFDGRPVDRQLLDGFSGALKQQGSDGEFFYLDGSIAFLYRPFYTTAESRREKQPYLTRRGFILTWDGRLDNRDEILLQLPSNFEVNPTDVAIVGAAFDRWQTDCFRRFIGDWAVSVWRQDSRELLLASDYIGIRHIFYYPKTRQVWWSTDLSPLVLLSGDKFHVDDDYVAGYFAHDPDAHLTPYREIHEVPPGQFVRIGEHSIEIKRYWRFSARSRIRYKTDAEYEEHFRHLFRQSVRRRLRSDSPVLAELSGGLDSSSIVCIADEILAKEKSIAPRLDTISFYDTTEPNGDDWIYLQKIEAHRGRTGHHIDASRMGSSPASLVYSEFIPVPGYLGSGHQLETERAAVVQGGGYRAVLSGMGGDEFLGAIPNPTAQLSDLLLRLRFIELARQLMAWGLVKRQPWIQLLGQAFRELLPPFLAQYLSSQAKIESWIEKQFAKQTGISKRLLDSDEHFGFWLPSRRSYIGGVLFMANKLSKWQSPPLALEEGRYPYLDQNLIEFGLSIPATQLLRPGERRSLMRRALTGIVPLDVLSRKTKQFGQRTPIIGLEKNLDQVRSLFDSPWSARLGYIDPARFQNALQSVASGTAFHTVRMLRAISLEIWLRDLASRRLLGGAPGLRSSGCTASLEARA